ncbi:ribonuclease domain-containing protein [Streptomyces sp. 142MFCol3.1]|uniref:ribonuclease domain-containing protein n=1 Tax=Streptomyces sp. 142MFCol3.1 TaxID=1172179 RepID=UPI00041B73B1|nr:ribonuclease domain-containing protein [Streptomyces sp. 142MFCol3.1]
MLLRSVPRALCGLLLCLAVLLTGCASTDTNPSTGTTATDTRDSTGTRASSGTPAPTGAGRPTAPPSWAGDLPTVAESRLPAEARRTLVLIDRGGPFPYAKDGAVFGNFERLLPRHERGYYHEYTVPTPGERDRGARRLVTGLHGEVYYTDDHYESFRAVLR